MNWILLGPDGSGKSTLAKDLSSRTGFRIKHFSNKNATIDQVERYLDVINNNDDMIYDRFIHDSWVYGPVFGGQSIATIEQIHEVEYHLNQKGAFLVYCIAPLPTLIQRMRQRDETGDFVQSKDIEKLKEVIERYEKLLEVTSLQIVLYEN